MKRTLLLVIVVSLMMTLGIVTQAQEAEQNILDLARDTDNLSTLVAAVEAADPAIAETLGGDGAYTVLAPTNQAFENLLITLDMEAEDLLANPLLTDILRYHVFSGEFFAEDIATLSGNFAGTFLPDNFVAVSVNEDGNIVLNDLVNVVSTDIDATNGVVHVIDNVLLPQSALEAFALVEAPNANVQVLHFAPDAPNVDVYVDGEVSVSNLGFGGSSGYMTVPAGDHELAVAPTGTSIDEAVIAPMTINLANGDYVNIAAVGSVANDTLTINTFTQDFPSLEEGEFAVTAFHAAEAANEVDITLNDDVVVDDLAYPNSQGANDGAFSLVATTPVESMTVNSISDDSELLDLTASGFEAGNYYLVVVGGTSDAPMPYIFPITGERADELDTALYDDTDMDDMEMEATEEPMLMSGNIAEIVMGSAANAEFTILLEALQNADPMILETLQGTEALTMFAPTDEAFNNLLSVTGMSLDELLESSLLDDLLRYHVVLGNLDSDTVATLDGELIPTLLEDTYIGVSVDDNADLVLNDVVGFVRTDIQADNGVIHIIDDVLLPQAILDELGL